ncbi:MAG: hypothetical protein ACTS6P_01105 [Candidatus Hodgkinia cicadicola]
MRPSFKFKHSFTSASVCVIPFNFGRICKSKFDSSEVINETPIFRCSAVPYFRLSEFNQTPHVDGTLNVLRSAITKGGTIFTVAQSFQHILGPNASKFKTIRIARPLPPFWKLLRPTCGRPDPSSPLRRNLATSDYVNHQHNFGRNNPNFITSIPPKGGLG